MRREGVIGDEAFHQLEEELDLSELAFGARIKFLSSVMEKKKALLN
jgi:hypothetical protein